MEKWRLGTGVKQIELELNEDFSVLYTYASKRDSA